MEAELRELYIELLKSAVRNTLYREEVAPPGPAELARVEAHLDHLRERFGAEVAARAGTATQVYHRLRANSPDAHTLADPAQIENVQRCVESVLASGVPGDLIETGVFRGGQTIFMRGLLKAHGVTDRRVFVADSFQGLPEPDPSHRSDAVAYEFLSPIGHFRVSEEAVRATFARYGLLDEQVCFLPGWFRDTLPKAPIERLAVMRLDGDWYQSTRDALENLYPKLSPGGFAIIDDYGIPIGCRRAVDEYRQRQGITEPLTWINSSTVYWQRAR
jgi:O-methyltransferase